MKYFFGSSLVAEMTGLYHLPKRGTTFLYYCNSATSVERENSETREDDDDDDVWLVRRDQYKAIVPAVIDILPVHELQPSLNFFRSRFRMHACMHAYRS